MRVVADMGDADYYTRRAEEALRVSLHHRRAGDIADADIHLTTALQMISLAKVHSGSEEAEK